MKSGCARRIRGLSWTITLALLLVTFGAGLAFGGAGASETCTRLERGPSGFPTGWEIIGLPRYKRGPSSVSSFAFARAGDLLVTNGTEVMRTTDDGCTWDSVFHVPDEMAGGEIAHIGLSPRGAVFALLSGPAGPALFTGEPSGPWSRSDVGILPMGMPADIVFDPGGAIAFLLVQLPGDPPASIVYASTDSGRTWIPDVFAGRSRNGHLVFQPERTRIDSRLIDIEFQNDALFASSPVGVFKREDGSWVDLSSRDSAVVASSSKELIAFSGQGPGAIRTRDGGRGWDEGGTPSSTRVASSSYLPAQDAFAISDGSEQGGIYIGHPMDSWRVVKDVGAGLEDLAVDGTGHLVGRGASGVYRLDPELVRPGPSISGVGQGSEVTTCSEEFEPTQEPPPAQAQQPFDLFPEDTKLAMYPGEQRMIPYQLSLEQRGLPLEVFFLVDTTGSMTPAICSLRADINSIANGLVDSGFDPRFGVGEFKDYPKRVYPHPKADPSDFAYRLLLPLSKYNDTVMRATLLRLSAGGGGDAPESALAGLLQATTGAGQSVESLDPEDPRPYVIPPGQQAGFRDRALKLIVTITDDVFNEQGQRGGNGGCGGDPDCDIPYPGPSFERVSNLLLREGIKVIGIHYNENSAQDLRLMAHETGAIAPAPVDCEDDGYVDIPKGAPLVCSSTPNRVDYVGSLGSHRPTEIYGLAKPIVEMIKSFKAEVDVELDSIGGSGVVKAIQPRIHTDVDLVIADHLRFEVTYSCTEAMEGQRLDVRLRAVVDVAEVASVPAEVICLSNSPVLPVTPGGALAVPPLPPPPPPPQPAPGPMNIPNTVQAPAPQMQPAPAQAQAGNPNPVAVSQRQEQPQMAFVHAANQLKQQLGAQNAMVRATPHRSDPLDAIKYGLAMSSLSMLLVYGFASLALKRVTVRNN